MDITREKELIDFIETKCNDWLKLKVVDIISKDKILIEDCEGYKYLTSITVIRNAKRRNIQLSKFLRNNPYTIDNIKNYLYINNISLTLISHKINNATEKITWNCNIHGDFYMSWNCIKNGQGCPECGKESAAEKNRNSYDYIQDEFNKRGMILISDTYINNETPLDFICLKHENKGVQQVPYGFIINKETGCKYCNKEAYFKKVTKSNEEFINEVKQVHNEKYEVLEKYKGGNKYIKIKCNECNYIWNIKASHLLSGHGCPRCKSPSKGEDIIRNYLEIKDITFKEQYRIKECRNKKPLPFDFAVINNSSLCLIEFDGKQHFEPIGFGELSEIKIYERFKEQKLRDEIKNNYCREKGIPLIRIPYWDINNIESILDTELSVFFNLSKEGEIING